MVIASWLGLFGRPVEVSVNSLKLKFSDSFIFDKFYAVTLTVTELTCLISHFLVASYPLYGTLPSLASVLLTRHPLVWAFGVSSEFWF